MVNPAAPNMVFGFIRFDNFFVRRYGSGQFGFFENRMLIANMIFMVAVFIAKFIKRKRNRVEHITSEFAH
jgi:hypothetical protein